MSNLCIQDNQMMEILLALSDYTYLFFFPVKNHNNIQWLAIIEIFGEKDTPTFQTVVTKWFVI